MASTNEPLPSPTGILNDNSDNISQMSSNTALLNPCRTRNSNNENSNDNNNDNEEEPAPKVPFSVLFLLWLVGLSAWIPVNGIFTELWALIPVLPEGKKLAANMPFVVQFGNIFPVIYMFIPFKNGRSYTVIKRTIFVILFGFALGFCFLGVFWDDRNLQWHDLSLGIYIGTFVVAGFGILTNMVYWPLIPHVCGNRKLGTSYLASGEATCSLVVSLIAVIQKSNDWTPHMFFYCLAALQIFFLIVFEVLTKRHPESLVEKKKDENLDQNNRANDDKGAESENELIPKSANNTNFNNVNKESIESSNASTVVVNAEKIENYESAENANLNRVEVVLVKPEESNENSNDPNNPEYAQIENENAPPRNAFIKNYCNMPVFLLFILCMWQNGLCYQITPYATTRFKNANYDLDKQGILSKDSSISANQSRGLSSMKTGEDAENKTPAKEALKELNDSSPTGSKTKSEEKKKKKDDVDFLYFLAQVLPGYLSPFMSIASGYMHNKENADSRKFTKQTLFSANLLWISAAALTILIALVGPKGEHGLANYVNMWVFLIIYVIGFSLISYAKVGIMCDSKFKNLENVGKVIQTASFIGCFVGLGLTRWIEAQ